jgi:hypothetical protein
MATRFDQLVGTMGSRIDRRMALGGLLGTAGLALAACSGGVSTAQASGKGDVQRVSTTVVGGLKLGSDGKLHDAFSPTDFTVAQNRPVELTVYNYDGGQHSLTAPDLKLDALVPAHKAKGDPSITTFAFTPTKAGKFMWNCDKTCDGGNDQWAMSQVGYMMGYITVTPGVTY